MQEQEEVEEERGGRAMLKSRLWIKVNMELARPPQQRSELPKAPRVPPRASDLVANLRVQLTPFPRAPGCFSVPCHPRRGPHLRALQS